MTSLPLKGSIGSNNINTYASQDYSDEFESESDDEVSGDDVQTVLSSGDEDSDEDGDRLPEYLNESTEGLDTSALDVDVSMDNTLEVSSSPKTGALCYSDEEESSAGENDLHLVGMKKTIPQVVVPKSSPYGRLLEQHRLQLSGSSNGSPQLIEEHQHYSPGQLNTPAKSQPWVQSSPHSLISGLESNSSSNSMTPELTSENIGKPSIEQQWAAFLNSAEKKNSTQSNDSRKASNGCVEGIQSQLLLPYSDEEAVSSSVESSSLKSEQENECKLLDDNSRGDLQWTLQAPSIQHSPATIQRQEPTSQGYTRQSPVDSNTLSFNSPHTNTHSLLPDTNKSVKSRNASQNNPSNLKSGVSPNLVPLTSPEPICNSNSAQISPFSPFTTVPTTTPPLPFPHSIARSRPSSESPRLNSPQVNDQLGGSKKSDVFSASNIQDGLDWGNSNMLKTQQEVLTMQMTSSPTKNIVEISASVSPSSLSSAGKSIKSTDSAFANVEEEQDGHIHKCNVNDIPSALSAVLNAEENDMKHLENVIVDVIPPPTLPFPSNSPNFNKRNKVANANKSPLISLHRKAVTNNASTTQISEGPVLQSYTDSSDSQCTNSPNESNLGSPQFHTPLPFASESPMNLDDFSDTISTSIAQIGNSSMEDQSQDVQDNMSYVSSVVEENNSFAISNQQFANDVDDYQNTLQCFDQPITSHQESQYDAAYHENYHSTAYYPWVEYLSEEGYPYYYNVETEESSWELPRIPEPVNKDVDHNTTMEFNFDTQKSGLDTDTIPIDTLISQSSITRKSSSIGGGNMSPMMSTCSSGGQSQAEPLSHLNKSGQTALHISASVCNIEALSLLLTTGADPDVQDGYGHTPLQVLCRVRPSPQQAGCIKTLLDHNVQCNIQDAMSGNTPLHSLIVWGMNCELLSECSNPNECPALFNLSSPEIQSVRQFQRESVSALVADSRVDLSIENFDGDQALHMAAKLGLLDIMQVLLQGPTDSHREKQTGSGEVTTRRGNSVCVSNLSATENVSNVASKLSSGNSVQSSESNKSNASSKRRHQSKSRSYEKHQNFWGNVISNEENLKSTIYSSSSEEEMDTEGSLERSGWETVSSKGSKTTSVSRRRQRERRKSRSHMTPDMERYSWKTVHSVKKEKNVSVDDRNVSSFRIESDTRYPVAFENESPPKRSTSPFSGNHQSPADSPSTSQLESIENENKNTENYRDENNTDDDLQDPELITLGVLRNGWVEYSTEDGDCYYYNSNNGHVQWKHPFQVELDRKAAKLEAMRQKKVAHAVKGDHINTVSIDQGRQEESLSDNVDEFFDIPTAEVVVHSLNSSEESKNMYNAASVTAATKTGGMHTMSVDTKSSPRNTDQMFDGNVVDMRGFVEGSHHSNGAHSDMNETPSYQHQTFDLVQKSTVTRSGNKSSADHDMYLKQTDSLRGKNVDESDVGDDVLYQFPSSLSTSVPGDVPVHSIIEENYVTPKKKSQTVSNNEVAQVIATENSIGYNRIDRTHSVSSLSDMTTDSIRTDKTEKHMEVWSRFFENAMMASSSVDESDGRRHKNKGRKPYVSVAGFTPVSSKKKSRVKDVDAQWAVPPSTQQYREIVNSAHELKVALKDGAIDSGTKKFLSKKLATISSEAVLAAAMRGDIETMENLLLTGFSPSCIDKQIRGPLHHACRAGDIDMVKLLNDYGVDLDATDVAGNTALHVACIAGRDAVIHCLLQCAADTTIRNNLGDSPLHIVASKGDLECTRLLMEYGASLDIKNGNGRTPLDVAMHALRAHRGTKPPLGVRKIIAALTAAQSTSFNSKLSSSNPASPVSLTGARRDMVSEHPQSSDQLVNDRVVNNLLVDANVDEEYSLTSGTLEGDDYDFKYGTERPLEDCSVSIDSNSSRSSYRRRSHRAHVKNNRRNEKKSNGIDSTSQHINLLVERARRARNVSDSSGNAHQQRSRDKKVRGKKVEEQADQWKEKGRLVSGGIPLHLHQTSPYEVTNFGDVSANISDDSVEDYDHVDTPDKTSSVINRVAIAQKSRQEDAEISSSDDDDDRSGNSSTFATGVNLWGAASSLIGATMQMFSNSPTLQSEEEEDKSAPDPFAPPPTDTELLRSGLGFEFDKSTVLQSPRPPPIVEADLKHAHDEAKRTGLTPRRGRPPTAPDEVVVAVEMARAAERHRRTPKRMSKIGTNVSHNLSNRHMSRPAPLDVSGKVWEENSVSSVNGYSMVKNGVLPTGVTSRYVDILNDPRNKL